MSVDLIEEGIRIWFFLKRILLEKFEKKNGENGVTGMEGLLHREA